MILSVIALLGTKSATSSISQMSLSLFNMLTGLLSLHVYMISFTFQSSIIFLYAGRTLFGPVNILRLGADLAGIRSMWWLTLGMSRSLVIRLMENMPGNYELE